MPSGYLKHQPGVTRKSARGGGSHRDFGCERSGAMPWLRRHTAWSRRDASLWEQSTVTPDQLDDNNYRHDDDEGQHEDDGMKEQQQESRCLVGTCAICCEENVPLIHLMKGCQKIHEPSCYDCLRRLYVTDAQKSVANYPLRCHHPACQKPVREMQLTKHQLVQNDAELTRYFRLMELSKGNKGGLATTTAHCPHCDHPRTFRAAGGLYRVFACRECGLEYVVPEHEDVIEALEALAVDEVGTNDGWAQCPRCKMLISKGDGCDHMHCELCHCDFSWSEAQSKRNKYAAKMRQQLTTADTWGAW